MIYENIKILNAKPSDNEYLIWDCLGKLRQIDIANAPGSLIMKHLMIAENEILARLVRPFESFLHSVQYKQWQEELLEAEKVREKASRVHRDSRNSGRPDGPGPGNGLSPGSGTGSGGSAPGSGATTPNPGTGTAGGDPITALRNNAREGGGQNSNRSADTRASCSDIYPDILIVDDSLVVLKLTGLTLEKDGHHVERAHNGQVALQLMKSHPYDVVLIDINMPVMDGFETVRLFREFESTSNTLPIPSEMSSISSSEGDFSRANVTARGTSSGDNPGTGTAALTNYDLAYRKPNLTAAHYHQLIIGISTNVDEETKVKALAAGTPPFVCPPCISHPFSGMDYFLPKPFSLQKFIETIRMSRMRPREVPPGTPPLNTNPLTQIPGSLLPAPLVKGLSGRGPGTGT